MTANGKKDTSAAKANKTNKSQNETKNTEKNETSNNSNEKEKPADQTIIESEASPQTTNKNKSKENIVLNEEVSNAHKVDKPKSEAKEKNDEISKNSPEIEQKKNSEQVIQSNTKNTMEESEKENDQNAKETNNDIDLMITPENPDESQVTEEKKVVDFAPMKHTSVTLMGVISFVFFGTIAVCLLLSCYYRLHLLKNKRAPFNAPRGLKPLFPTPVNYEYEITQLCDKYLSQ